MRCERRERWERKEEEKLIRREELRGKHKKMEENKQRKVEKEKSGELRRRENTIRGMKKEGSKEKMQVMVRSHTKAFPYSTLKRTHHGVDGHLRGAADLAGVEAFVVPRTNEITAAGATQHRDPAERSATASQNCGA